VFEVRSFSSAAFINTTFYGNISEAGPGSAISNGDYSSVSLINSIVWGNNGESSIYNEPVDDEDNSEVYVNSSIVEGGFDGETVIDADPLFVDPAENDFHVADGSLSIGTGLDLAGQASNTFLLRLRDTGNDGHPQNGFVENENGDVVQEFQGGDWGSETIFGPFDLPDGDYSIRFDWDDNYTETSWDLITEAPFLTPPWRTIQPLSVIRSQLVSV
jgi:hypothetical protein